MKDYKDIDNLLHEIYSDQKEIKIPPDLNKQIMHKIVQLQEEKKLQYKPVINKQVWWGIGAVLVLLITLPLLYSDFSSGWLDKIKMPDVKTPLLSFAVKILSMFPEISIPDYVLFTALVLPASFLIYLLFDRWIERSQNQHTKALN